MIYGGSIFGKDSNDSGVIHDRSKDFHSMDSNIMVMESDEHREYVDK